MNFLKKLLVLLIALVTVASCFAACGGDADDTTEIPKRADSDVDEYGRDYIADSVPADLRFDGETVTFFTRNDNDYWKIEMDTESTTNDTVNDAIFYRNATVEDRLGITIDQIQQPGGFGSHTQWLQSLRNTVLTKTGDYDCAAVYASQGSALATEGMYYNVKELEYLDLKKPWWNQTLLTELELFDTMTILSEFTNTEMQELAELEITVQAFAVQAFGFSDSFIAMKRAFPDHFEKFEGFN